MMPTQRPRRGLVWLVVAALLLAATTFWITVRRPAMVAVSTGPMQPLEAGAALGSKTPAASEAVSKAPVWVVEPDGLKVATATKLAATEPVRDASANPAKPSEPAAVGAPAPALSEREATVQAVRAAATTYDTAAAEEVAKYLNHPDPEVRAEAVRAMVVAGDAAGAALLRKASEQIKDPREAVTYLDAADFLELPPALPLGERGR